MVSNQRKFIIYEDENDWINYDLNKIYNMNFTLDSLYSQFHTNDYDVLQFLAGFKMIKNRMLCGTCNSEMCLVKSVKCMDGYVWICNEHEKRIQVSVRAFSFFEGMRKPFKTIFLFLYYWSAKDIQCNMGRELRLNKNTVTEWSLVLRETCQMIFELTDVKLGGVDENENPIIVEIDESLFFKRKYNRGRLRNQLWVFGMVERGSNKSKLVIVPNRSRDTLEPIIKHYILSGSHIISDQWAAYSFLNNDNEYTYSSVNHSQNFVSPENPQVHTQNIESSWLHCKNIIRKQFGTQEHMLEGYLYEYMFRKSVGVKEKNFNELLIVIIQVNCMYLRIRF